MPKYMHIRVGISAEGPHRCISLSIYMRHGMPFAIGLFIFRCAAGGLFTLVRAEHVKNYPIYEFRRQMALNLYSINNFRPLGATGIHGSAQHDFYFVVIANRRGRWMCGAFFAHDDRIANDMNIKISKIRTKRKDKHLGGCVCVCALHAHLHIKPVTMTNQKHREKYANAPATQM